MRYEHIMMTRQIELVTNVMDLNDWLLDTSNVKNGQLGGMNFKQCGTL